METNTELLNRIEAHIKGRLAVAESRAASSELYEGKKIAYNSILGFVNSLRTDLAATTAENTEAVRVLGPDEQVSFYESQAAAARALGCSHKTVWGCVKTGRRFQGKYLIQRAK